MKMPIIVGIVLGTLLAVVVIFIVILFANEPKHEDFQHLVEPRIVEKGNINALVVDFDGDPNIVIKEAYTKLFKVYYSLKGVTKGPKQPSPIARYHDFDVIVGEGTTEEKLKSVPWKGFVAIALPKTVASLHEKARATPYPARIETVAYGTVAEIVHFGSYQSEMPTINKLKAYIKSEGYEIAGLHEEDYIIGPGMPFRKPESYITIIRYQVKKAEK